MPGTESVDGYFKRYMRLGSKPKESVNYTGWRGYLPSISESIRADYLYKPQYMILNYPSQ